MTALILSCTATWLAVGALAFGAYQWRLSEIRRRLINQNTEAILEIMSAHEQRINRVETYAYSGGAIDQRPKGSGGVW